MTDTSNFISAGLAAKLAGVSRHRLARAVQLGELRCWTVNTAERVQLIYSRNEVENWAKAARAEPTQ